ncbi:MAG TPA: hypothetical protein VGF45_01245 [Polyangia bacterium]
MRRPECERAGSAVPLAAVLVIAVTASACTGSRASSLSSSASAPSAPAVGATGAERPRGREVPTIGLQRGGRWSVISIRPPHLSGPLFHLQLKNSVLTGAVSGGSAPGGTLRVNIKEDGAEGFGPVGPISLDYAMNDHATVAEGTWNGGRVRLVFARESLKGTVTANSMFHNRSEGNATFSMENSRRFRRSGRTIDSLEPPAADLSCEYDLNELGGDGALSGGSTCAGMPQQTRLEVPAMAKTWLTHAELVTVLVAVLSAPPVLVSEEFRR